MADDNPQYSPEQLAALYAASHPGQAPEDYQKAVAAARNTSYKAPSAFENAAALTNLTAKGMGERIAYPFREGTANVSKGLDILSAPLQNNKALISPQQAAAANAIQGNAPAPGIDTTLLSVPGQVFMGGGMSPEAQAATAFTNALGPNAEVTPEAYIQAATALAAGKGAGEAVGNLLPKTVSRPLAARLGNATVIGAGNVAANAAMGQPIGQGVATNTALAALLGGREPESAPAKTVRPETPTGTNWQPQPHGEAPLQLAGEQPLNPSQFPEQTNPVAKALQPGPQPKEIPLAPQAAPIKSGKTVLPFGQSVSEKLPGSGNVTYLGSHNSGQGLDHWYSIETPKGKLSVNVTVDPANPAKAAIDISPSNGEETKNALGATGLRTAMRDIKAHNPDLETITYKRGGTTGGIRGRERTFNVEGEQAKTYPLAAENEMQRARPEAPPGTKAAADEIPLAPKAAEPAAAPKIPPEELRPNEPAIAAHGNAETLSKAAASLNPKKIGGFIRDWYSGVQSANRMAAGFRASAAPIINRLEQWRGKLPAPDSAEGINLINNMEATGRAPNPAHQGFADDNAAAMAEVHKLAKAAGTDISKWNPYWFKRLAKKPQGMKDVQYGQSLMGAENYLRARTNPTYGDFVQAAKANGLELPFKDLVDVQQAGIAEVLKSASVGKELKNMDAHNNAMELGPKEEVPPGWKSLDGLLGEHGEKMAVPAGTYRAFDNILKRSGNDLTGAFNTMRSVRNVTDLAILRKAINGYFADTLMHPNRLASRAKNLKTAMKLSRDEGLLNDPAYAPVRKNLENIAEQGGFSRNYAKVGPNYEKQGWGAVTDMLNAPLQTAAKHTIGTLRDASALDAAEEAAEHPEWSEEQQRAFLTSASKTIDRVMGGEHSPTGLPPALDRIVSIIQPYWRHRTGAIRQEGAAIGSLLRGNKSAWSPAAKGAVGMLAAHAIQNGIAQIVFTKWNTGHVIWPTSIKDLSVYQTGEKDENGNPSRASTFDSVLPEVELATRLLQGRMGKELSSSIDPTLTAGAQAVTGRDELGRPMTMGDRALGILRSALFMPYSSPQGHNILTQMLGQRNMPKDVAGSKAYNTLRDAVNSKTATSARTPEEQKQWQRWNQLADTPEHWRANSVQILDEMKQDPTVTRAAVENAAKRWAMPNDLGRMAADKSLSPADLMDAWKDATIDEKRQMFPSIYRRMSALKNNGRASMQTWKEWESLEQAMKS